ncbi:MAG: response regulator, partial [Prochloraceae cyanobacterium]
GRLDIESPTGLKWSLYLYLGRLVWQSGGIKPLERWLRLLKQYCPEIEQLERLEPQNSHLKQYKILTHLIRQRRVDRSRVVALVQNALIEVLFDILQQELYLLEQHKCHLSFKSIASDYPQSLFTLVRTEQVLGEAKQQWELWQKLRLTAYSPNLVPIIQQPERLQKHLENSSDRDLGLTKLVDGKRTLRNLSLELQQDLPKLTSLLVQYVNSGMMSFVEAEGTMKTNFSPEEGRRQKAEGRRKLSQGDFTPPDRKPLKGKSFIARPHTIPSASPPYEPRVGIASRNKPFSASTSSNSLVVCIDDSATVCTHMKQIVTLEACNFLEIQDAVKTIPTLLKNKPDLIFLDLIMPISNGYELCSQIRQISSFKKIPIVILTSKDGLIDRVRAKIVGANDFLAKPIDQKKVLSMLQKYVLTKPQLIRS